MIIALSLLVCLVGLLLYLAISGNEHPKLVEVGRLMFAMGMLAFLILARWPLTVTAPGH